MQMFSIDPIHPIYSAIIEILVLHPNTTIAQLHERLQKYNKVKTSLSHLYRIVNRMIDNQIIVRIKGALSLNSMWVSYVEFIASKASKATSNVNITTLQSGEKQLHKANSMLDVEAIWNHILVNLYRSTQHKQIFKYYSHAWWQLGRNAEETSFYRALKARGIDCKWVLGSQTPLDMHGAERINSVYSCVTTNNAPFLHDGYCLNVFGDYILECILPKNIAKLIIS